MWRSPRLKTRLSRGSLLIVVDEDGETKKDDRVLPKPQNCILSKRNCVASIQAKLKTLNDLPILLLNVTQTLNKFAQVLDSASSKAGDQSVHSAGQANTMPAEEEKNTNQATIS
ncbi:hypothetical protein Tco_0256244 [Tanacetum coccineum]